MSKAYKYIVFFGLIAGVYSCKDVVNEVPDTPFYTTPYAFTYNDQLLPPPRVPSDNKLTNEGVFLGRMLFYDPILSADSSQSCSSCHNQKNAFTDNGLQFSEGIRGTKGTRNSMPIFNLMWHLDGFFWDGRADILRHQALIPIEDPVEMDETIGNVLVKLNGSPLYTEHFNKAYNSEEIDEELVGKALEQFMLSIVSAGSKFDKVQLGLETFTDKEKIGAQIFNAEAITIDDERNPSAPQNFGADCFHCHGSSLFMRREYLNNGLPNNGDKGLGGANGNAADDCKFKTPSLRNIALTGPYMHDGRMETLEEVVQFYLGKMEDNCTSLSNSPNLHALKDSIYLSDDHKESLVLFLKTLTDEELINDERYSDPF